MECDLGQWQYLFFVRYLIVHLLVKIEVSQSENLFCPCREDHYVTTILAGHGGRVEVDVVLRVVEGNADFRSETFIRVVSL